MSVGGGVGGTRKILTGVMKETTVAWQTCCGMIQAANYTTSFPASLSPRSPERDPGNEFDMNLSAMQQSYFKRLGNGWFMAKTDIKSAFRIIPFHPRWLFLAWYEMGQHVLFDRCLAMGLSSSSAILNPLAQHWLHWNGCPLIISVLLQFYIF